MSNIEKMIQRINRTLQELDENYVRDIMVCADTLLDIQRKKAERS